MTGTRRPRLVAAVALAVLGLLTSCRGVPTSSAPQKVTSVGLGQGQQLPIQPGVNDGPRDIVGGFLQANGIAAARSSSSSFLTKSEQSSWSDSSATIIADEQVGTYNADAHTLTVTGRVVGTLDKNGIYNPTLSGTGQGGPLHAFTFGLATVHGQNRISSVPNPLGLLITTDQFDSAYQAHELYFFDSADRYLVPDIRYTSLDDPGALADWLLAQLANGPRPALTTAVSTDTLPTRVQEPQAKVGPLTQVQIDGARQLSVAARDRLAAQLSATLNVPGIGDLAITDSGSRVFIPQVRGTDFSAANFKAALGPRQPPPIVYYLNSSRRIKQAGGPVLHGEAVDREFDSIALSRPPQIRKLTIAGVVGQQLQVSTVDAAWRPLSLHSPQLSRPSWAPGLNEVWIAAGPTLYRIVTDGRANKVYQVPLPASAPSGRIAAVRISPDGSRIALVFAAGTQAGGSLYIGSIVRNGTVSVAGLTTQGAQISPQDVRITDVAWADSLKLYATGYLAKSGDARVFETRADGADWTDLGLSTLPGKASTITATTGAPAWVDANGFVWRQSGLDWLSPTTSQDQTQGTKPMYLG